MSKLTELYGKLKGDVETDMTLETILRFAAMIDKLGDTLIRSRYLVVTTPTARRSKARRSPA